MKVDNGQIFKLHIRKGQVNIDTMQEYNLYYYEDTGRVWLYCPCGEGHLISIPTIPTGKGIAWTITGLSSGVVTMYPSILNEPCGAHFFIRDGKIIWA